MQYHEFETAFEKLSTDTEKIYIHTLLNTIAQPFSTQFRICCLLSWIKQKLWFINLRQVGKTQKKLSVTFSTLRM